MTHVIRSRPTRAVIAMALVAAIAPGSGAVAKPKPKANTLLLGDLGNGETLWLVLDSVKLDEKLIRHGWSVINYATPQTAHDISYSSDASKFYVNCKTMDVDLANAIKYSEPMAGGKNLFQVNSEPTPEPDAKDYHPAHPGTAELAVATAICKQKIR
jgi:hypothetical protein